MIRLRIRLRFLFFGFLSANSQNTLRNNLYSISSASAKICGSLRLRLWKAGRAEVPEVTEEDGLVVLGHVGVRGVSHGHQGKGVLKLLVLQPKHKQKGIFSMLKQ
jgi:hypothetical protein